jgi:hypothetical protein
MSKVDMLERVEASYTATQLHGLQWAYVEMMKFGRKDQINPSYEIFQYILDHHDWYYHYSDDHRAYSKGQDVSNLIDVIRKQDDVFEQMYLRYLDDNNMRAH